MHPTAQSGHRIRPNLRKQITPLHVAASKSQYAIAPARWIMGFFFLMLLFAAMVIKVDAAEPIHILVYGDSLSAGYQLPAGAGFADQLEDHLKKEGFAIEITNASVSGDTTANGLSRLDWSTPDKVDLVLLELGANDALQGLPVDAAKANLSRMIEKFQNHGAKVMLMGMRSPPNMGQDYVSAFNAIFPALAKEYKLPFFPFFLENVAARPELNLSDGMHPNQQGIKIIVENVAPHVIDIVKTTY